MLNHFEMNLNGNDTQNIGTFMQPIKQKSPA